MIKKVMNVQIDSSLHCKAKEMAIKNQTNIVYEVEEALRKHIQSELEKEILVDSGIEILINKKSDRVDKHLASYIGKLDKNIYQLLASSLLLLRSSRSDLYEKYNEEDILEFLNYKGNLLSKNKVGQTD